MRYIYIPDAVVNSGRKGEIYVRFDVLKVALLWCRGLGGPPRVNAGRFSAAGRKAGSKVGSAPWQFPADRLAKPDSWPPWELPSLRCDPLTLSHFLPGPGADYRDHEKTGGRGWLPVSCIAK